MATDKAALSPLAFQTANVFAPTPHAGNQAAVVIFPESDPRSTDDEYYRSIAADFNLAETAFVVEKDIEAAVPRYGLRWFTPEVVSATAVLDHVRIDKGSELGECGRSQSMARSRPQEPNHITCLRTSG